MPTPANKARLRKLYARLGSLKATAAASLPGRADVMNEEAALVAKEIQTIKDSYKD
jgi:hypothetical protein